LLMLLRGKGIFGKHTLASNPLLAMSVFFLSHARCCVAL
jgi:hypothetical protein